MSKQFSIKPLEWTETQQVGYSHHNAETIFCILSIEPERRWLADSTWVPTGRWVFEWSVDDYYDEGQEVFGTVFEAKAAADVWYLSRLMPALEPKQ